MKIGIPKDGRFGDFGGKYIPETLAPAIEELEKNYLKIRNDKNFKKELGRLLIDYAGRPTPIYFARNLTKTVGGAKIYLKREDLLHGGAHKINNTLGQALLAKRMGKKRIIAANYIKIDIEGSEKKAIMGLNHQIPLISFECNIPYFKKEMFEILKKLSTLGKYEHNFLRHKEFIFSSELKS